MADDSKLSVQDKKLLKACSEGESKELEKLLSKKANPNASKVAQSRLVAHHVSIFRFRRSAAERGGAPFHDDNFRALYLTSSRMMWFESPARKRGVIIPNDRPCSTFFPNSGRRVLRSFFNCRRLQAGATALHCAARYNHHACVALLLKHGADPFATNVVKKQSWALPLSSRQDNPCVARNPELAESSLHLHPSPPALAHLSSLRALALTCLAPVPWAPSRRQQGESALFVAIDDGAEESEAVITTHVKALAIKGSASKAAKDQAKGLLAAAAKQRLAAKSAQKEKAKLAAEAEKAEAAALREQEAAAAALAAAEADASTPEAKLEAARAAKAEADAASKRAKDEKLAKMGALVSEKERKKIEADAAKAEKEVADVAAATERRLKGAAAIDARTAAAAQRPL